MIILAYDIETTGVDKQKDRIIEYGFALYSTEQHKVLESAGFLVKSDVPVLPKITEITGITQSAVDYFGYDPKDSIEQIIGFINRAEAILTHNGNRFDLPMTRLEAARFGLRMPEKLSIDTMTDIPGIQGEQLVTMCAKHGFININQHSAEDDAKSVLKLISFHSFDEIVERAKMPTFIVRAHQARHENDLAKELKFRWNGDLKIWWKPIKEVDFPALQAQASFRISIEKELTLEQLD